MSRREEQFTEAVAIRPDCGRTLFDRGVVHMVGSEWDNAERDLITCVKKLPNLGEAWLRKSKCVTEGMVQRGDKMSVRMKHVLVDYANALVLFDYNAEKAQERKDEERKDELEKMRKEFRPMPPPPVDHEAALEAIAMRRAEHDSKTAHKPVHYGAVLNGRRAYNVATGRRVA